MSINILCAYSFLVPLLSQFGSFSLLIAKTQKLIRITGTNLEIICNQLAQFIVINIETENIRERKNRENRENEKLA